VALMVQQTGVWQAHHFNILAGLIAAPLSGINRNLMAFSRAVGSNTQHVALHTAKRKIFKNEKGEFQRYVFN